VPLSLSLYVSGTIELACSAQIKSIRKGYRANLQDEYRGHQLARYLGGRIPYHYRTPENIGADFSAGHDAIEMVLSLFSQAPTTPKFQNSHSGEILSSIYLEEVVGYQRLYSKLTLTTAENTNVHKMDGFFVKTDVSPFHYLFVEAKTSIHPHGTSTFRGHRSGVLKQMIRSLGSYVPGDERFDLTRIRDNLSQRFDPAVAKEIKADLVPPGPLNSSFMGIAVVNAATVNQKDDDYILGQPCEREFEFRALVVSDLAALAKEAYRYGKEISESLKKGGH
jgi:hypothetical protein